MLFRETVDAYCENNMDNTNTLCGYNAEFWNVKSGGNYDNRWALKGWVNHKKNVGHVIATG
jgi:hypothetical protein